MFFWAIGFGNYLGIYLYYLLTIDRLVGCALLSRGLGASNLLSLAWTVCVLSKPKRSQPGLCLCLGGAAFYAFLLFPLIAPLPMTDP